MSNTLRSFCILIFTISTNLTARAIEIELPLSGGNSIFVSLTENFCPYDSSKLEIKINGNFTGKLEYLYDGLNYGNSTDKIAVFYLKESGEFKIFSYGSIAPVTEMVDTSIIINLTHYEIPSAIITGGGSYCQGDNIDPLAINFSGTAPWNLYYQPNATSYVEDTFNVSPVILSESENYKTNLRYISDAHCFDTISEQGELIISELPDAGIIGDTVFCPDDNAIYSTYQNNLYQYTWSIPEGAENIASTELKSSYVALTWVESGIHTVNLRVVDASTGCSSGQLSKDILVHNLPPVKKDLDTLICFGIKGYITISPAANNNNSIFWHEYQLEAQEIEIFDTGTYTYTETIPFGCKDLGSINIIEKCLPDIFVPEAFTPNNDDINDVLEIFGNHYERLTLYIYSANGQIIYTQFPNSPYWDGRINNKDAPNGVYYWRATFYDVFGKEYQDEGKVTLIR